MNIILVFVGRHRTQTCLSLLQYQSKLDPALGALSEAPIANGDELAESGSKRLNKNAGLVKNLLQKLWGFRKSQAIIDLPIIDLQHFNLPKILGKAKTSQAEM